MRGMNMISAAAVMLMLIQLLPNGAVQVLDQQVKLRYHKGPLLITRPSLTVHVIWYGSFSQSQHSILTDFLHSFQLSPQPQQSHPSSLATSTAKSASVSSWWNTLHSYTPAAAKSATTATQRQIDIHVDSHVTNDAYSKGKSLSRRALSALVRDAVPANVSDSDVFLILTAVDVTVEGFCRNTCGLHSHVRLRTNGRRPGVAPYAWVGNAERLCPGLCAWPFHVAPYGPTTFRKALTPPNADVGADGMIMNVATTLAGMVTNPFGSGFFQGHPGAPLEAASACAGIFGNGAYPGFPGELPVDPTTGGSYNVVGGKRRYLLPALWDPVTSTCQAPSA